MAECEQVERVPRLVNILGKDYLTIDEAAFYACVSRSQFCEHAARFGLHPIDWMGKKVYRKTDIQRAIERQWQSSAFGKTGKASRRITSSRTPTKPAAAIKTLSAKSES